MSSPGELFESDPGGFVHPSGWVRLSENGRLTLIWILVLLLVILAIGGGLAFSKFLFILLVLAVIVALLGARSAA